MVKKEMIWAILFSVVFLFMPGSLLVGTGYPAGDNDAPQALYRKMTWDVVLTPPGKEPAVIVYPSSMTGGRLAAEDIQQAVKQWCGQSLPLMDDKEATSDTSWLFKEDLLK